MTTPRGAPELTSGQAVPETTVNEQIRRTEAGACHFPVVDKDLTAPPGSCSDGANYIIAGSPTGLWSGKAGQVATAVGANAASGWYYHTPIEGFTAYAQDENAAYYYDGSAWALEPDGEVALVDLTDVDPTGLATGDVPTWDGAQFVMSAPPGSGGGSGGTVPTGGSDGQVLAKASGVDHDTEWVSLPNWGNWTELTFAGSTNSNLGRSSYLANETFSLAATDRLEIEVEVEKAENSDITIGVKVGSSGYYLAGQGNDVIAVYRYTGGAATSESALSGNVAYDYSGSYTAKFILNVKAAASNNLYAVCNDLRIPSTGGIQNTSFTMIGTAEIFVEGTIKRARARAIT
jgi:hypothetical protein